MGQVLHGSAATTQAVRIAIQRSQALIAELSRRYGINPKTVAKWRKRETVDDAPMGPKERRSSVLRKEEEALVITFRRHTLLPLNDCLYALQASLPYLTRSSLQHYLQRHEISGLPEVEGSRSKAASTKPNHPWTNGQVERMNRTLKHATVRRYHYETHDALRAHPATFLDAYNFARRLKTLRGLTPFAFISQTWTSEPLRFRLHTDHFIPGPNS